MCCLSHRTAPRSTMLAIPTARQRTRLEFISIFQCCTKHAAQSKHTSCIVPLELSKLCSLSVSVERVVLSQRDTSRTYHCGPVVQLQPETLKATDGQRETAFCLWNAKAASSQTEQQSTARLDLPWGVLTRKSRTVLSCVRPRPFTFAMLGHSSSASIIGT